MTLQERIENKKAMIEKKTALIEKMNGRIEKNLKKLGIETFDADDREMWNKDFDTMFKIKSSYESIKNATEAIEEAKQAIEELTKKVEAQEAKDKEVPDCLKEFEKIVVEKWDEYDKQYKEFLKKKYREMDYRDFIKAYGGAGYQLARFTTEEQIHKTNVRDAHAIVLNLVRRVKDYAGTVTDWKGLHVTVGNNNCAVINGLVIGTEGKARVESIEAGGYNIQRWHIRTLVHKA